MGWRLHDRHIKQSKGEKMNSEQVVFELRDRLEVVDALYRFGAGIDFNNDLLLTSALAPNVTVDFTPSNKPSDCYNPLNFLERKRFVNLVETSRSET